MVVSGTALTCIPAASSFLRSSSLSRWLSARSNAAVFFPAVMMAFWMSAGSFS